MSDETNAEIVRRLAHKWKIPYSEAIRLKENMEAQHD